jgi:polyhydroxyalkanoate synthesis regulator phasin
MNFAEPLHCDPEQFQSIYQNLTLFGTSDHERIILNTDGLRYFPMTTKRQRLDFADHQNYKTSSWVVDFFENNLECLANESDSQDFLSKLKPLFKGDKELKIRCDKIRQELFSINAIKGTEQYRTAMLQEAEKKIQKVEKELENKIQKAEKKIQKDLEDYQKQAQELETRLEILKQTIVALEDTLLVCKDRRIGSHLKYLQKICFFQRYKNNFDLGMKKKFIIPEGEDKYKYAFDFTDFCSKTISSLLDWLDKPESLKKICNFSALYELYRLADILSDSDFKSDCFSQLKGQLTEENRAEVLSLVNFSIDDPLIKECCDFTRENFHAMIGCEKFLGIQQEYLINSIKNAKKGDRCKLFEWMVKWANAQAKEKNMTTQKILYSQVDGISLISRIDFELLSKEKFLSKVFPRKVLTSEDTCRWLEFYLKKDLTPISAPFDFRKSNESQAEVLWNISLEKFYNLAGDSIKIISSPRFYFGGCKWYALLQRSSRVGNIVVRIRADNPKVKYECFLQINGLYYSSDLSDQGKSAAFSNEKVCTKGVHYTPKELEDNLDLATGCLPVKFTIFLKNRF